MVQPLATTASSLDGHALTGGAIWAIDRARTTCVDKWAEKQARSADSGLGATINELASDQPAAKKGNKHRNDQENIPQGTVFLWTWCQYLLCTVTVQVAASSNTAVDAFLCEMVTALPGNTDASVLQAVPASDRTLRKPKVSQPDAAGAATLVMLSADV